MMTTMNPVQAVDAAFLFIIGFALLFLTAVTVTMVYFVIKYRRSRHPVAADIRGNVWLEIVWTVVPTIIALAMFYYGWAAYLNLRNVPADALTIKTTAGMFYWVFEYPNGKVSDGELWVPQGRNIKLEIASDDVLHSLFIPGFRIKRDAVPGMTTYAWFYADELGHHDILCAEYCGTGHSAMNADLIIVAPESFDEWLADGGSATSVSAD